MTAEQNVRSIQVELSTMPTNNTHAVESSKAGPLKKGVRLHDQMALYKIIFLLFAGSLPIVVLVVVGRQLITVFRSLRDRRLKSALLSVSAIAGILLLFAALLAVWFVYGVGHSSKNIFNEFVLITVTGTLVYGSSYGLWRLARHIDEKPGRDAA